MSTAETASRITPPAGLPLEEGVVEHTEVIPESMDNAPDGRGHDPNGNDAVKDIDQSHDGIIADNTNNSNANINESQNQSNDDIKETCDTHIGVGESDNMKTNEADGKDDVNVENSGAIVNTSGMETSNEETMVTNQGTVTEKDYAHRKGTGKTSELKFVEPVKVDTGTSQDGVIDIVKQSKLSKGSGKTRTGSEFGESGIMGEFPQSRPFTDHSMSRDDTHTEDIEREQRDRFDVRDIDTPFSVSVERKPLHVAPTRSHSDYFSKTPSTSRYTYIAASFSRFTDIEPDLHGKDRFFRLNQQQHRMRARRPPKLVRLATVTMSPKTKPLPRGPSLYYEEPKKPTKIITWDEANEARPPLRVDMEGPGPCQYTPRTKPLYETNSPSWSFGAKCEPEKAGGSRTSWEKKWFHSPNVWTTKVDFYNDTAWPTPTQYRQKTMLGPRQRTMVEAPSFTIGVRKEMNMNKTGSDKEPSPVDYDRDMADKLVMPQGPRFSHQFRREGTVMWSSKDNTPGPGAYDPKFSYNKPHGPNFSIRNLRREKSHFLGPFSTF